MSPSTVEQASCLSTTRERFARTTTVSREGSRVFAPKLPLASNSTAYSATPPAYVTLVRGPSPKGPASSLRITCPRFVVHSPIRTI
jgi:hypothetical protein